ncbi:glucosaminidase domain-containing protein [Erwinia sp. INIA-01]|uniref:glucosaminidase domain-containing protein n=1 Tax=Erwinia sp. INIA01 TaxID=2991500 RepID=UPI0022246838|nr:glucosaminidase domain-containing protein [Erwinia sp. INIA01]MCW1877696.1 glucosaminidase domain-containing protein [Erwinia sp. INIA01]
MKMVLPIDGYRSAKEFMEAMQGSEGDTHWLMKQAEHWHGGIHLCDGFASNTVFKTDSHGLKCMTDGQVVAWRLNDDYQTVTYGKKTLKFSSTFVLIKSTCTPDKDKPDNALDFFTLWMQIAPMSEYGITDTPTATVTASTLKIRQDNTSPGWIRSGLREGVNVPRDALRYYEVPQDTHTTLPRGSVVEIKQEASFLLNGKPAPFIFVSVVSVPEATKSGLSVGESGWISGLDKFVRRQGNASPAWMQVARQYGVFNKVVTVSGEDALTVKAGEIIGHLSLNERPSGGPLHFCHLEVFSQDTRMKDFLANKAGVTTGAAELHTLADKTRWKHREQDNSFVVAGVGGDPSPTTAERYTPESECRQLEADGKTWYYIPGELAWMAAEDVERANQFDLEKRGFMPLEQEDAPESIFQTPKESWLHQVYGQLEALARSETRDMYSSSYTEQYQKLLKQMDLNQDGVIDAGELWRFLHNSQPHIQYQVQRFVVKHHSEWLKDGMSALWQAALNEQAKKYPDMALYNRDFINKLVWMKDVPEIRSSEALWHMHPIVFLDAIAVKRDKKTNRPKNVQDFLDMASEAAMSTASKWGIPASVLLAQSALESGWGLHVKNNAYFGIKGKSPSGNSVSFGTTEVINGKVIHINDTFRAYSNYAESADDYGHFLSGNKRYKPAFLYIEQPNEFITEVANAGYATDPNYATKLIHLMRRYDFYEFDK